jgi:hypothetical protein
MVWLSVKVREPSEVTLSQIEHTEASAVDAAVEEWRIEAKKSPFSG